MSRAKVKYFEHIYPKTKYSLNKFSSNKDKINIKKLKKLYLYILKEMNEVLDRMSFSVIKRSKIINKKNVMSERGQILILVLTTKAFLYYILLLAKNKN